MIPSKPIFIASLILALALGNGAILWHFTSAAKREETAAIAAATAKAQAAAAIETQSLRTALQDAENAAHSEIVPDTRIVYVPRSVQNNRTARMPANTGAATCYGTATAPALPGSVVPETPDELRAEFEQAKFFDRLIADYRELYNAWPQTSKSENGRD